YHNKYFPAINNVHYFQKTQSAKSWLFTLLFREFLKEKRLEGVSTSSIIPQGRCTKQAASTPILAALTKVRKELQAPLILFYAKDLLFSKLVDYFGVFVDAL